VDQGIAERTWQIDQPGPLALEMNGGVEIVVGTGTRPGLFRRSRARLGPDPAPQFGVAEGLDELGVAVEELTTGHDG